MPVEITTALIGIIGILLGAWGGAAISRSATIRATESANQNAIEIMRRQESSIAVAKLRATFAPAQARIKLAGDNNLHVVCNILTELVPIHAAAIEEFRPFVPESDRAKYQKAWEDCYQTAMQGAPYAAGQASEQEITIIEFFDKKIHDILAFAEKMKNHPTIWSTGRLKPPFTLGVIFK